jgi:hypothetical protein
LKTFPTLPNIYLIHEESFLRWENLLF